MAALKIAGSNDELVAACSTARTIVLIGPSSALRDAKIVQRMLCGSPQELGDALGPIVLAMARDEDGDVHGSSVSSHVAIPTSPALTKLVLVVLPDNSSRYYSPTHSLAVTGGLLDAKLAAAEGTALVVALAPAEHASAVACGVARALPLYSRKTRSPGKRGLTECTVAFQSKTDTEFPVRPSMQTIFGIEAVRNAALLADTPCCELDTQQFEDAARIRLEGVPNVQVYSIVGVDELRHRGLNGIATVGQAALCEPRLVVLELTPTDPAAAAAAPIGLVGKGIVYDTGGLNLKTNGGRGMKDDCAGAAAALGAFELLARLAEAGAAQVCQAPLFAALCIAENAIGPGSYRPDDIVTMHSGKTVEVIDTDSEGRFVIGDGCSWLARQHGCTTVIDAATLTGHSRFTGQYHAGVLSNDAQMEQIAVDAGLECGEHVVPMIFAPEQAQQLLSSPVADLANDPPDGEAHMYSSVSGYFVYAQVADLPGVRWLHIDFGDPEMHFFAQRKMSSSGFAVGLMATIAQKVAGCFH